MDYKFRDRKLAYGSKTLLIGILNITPDSFSDGGRYVDIDKALAQAESLLQSGADIIDIGGESTRPGSQPVTAATEIERIAPLVKRLRELYPDAVISIDTWKSEVARAMLELGVDIINDVYGLQGDPELAKVVAEYNAGVIIMNNPTFYLPERPQSKVFPKRQDLASPDPEMHAAIAKIYTQDIGVNACLKSARLFLAHSLEIAHNAGIADDHIMLDPGLGFGLTESENIMLIKNLHTLKEFDNHTYPLLSAPSRKRFLRNLLVTDNDADTTIDMTALSYRRIEDMSADREKNVNESALDAATGAICMLSVENGADAVRVHNVAAIAPMLKIQQQLSPTQPQLCYLSLGSNMGDRKYYLEQAVDKLRELPGVCDLRVASIYETAPWGNTDQQTFLNTAVAFNYSYDAYRLIAECQKIELSLGRERHEQWGPRTIDIDIIFFGNSKSNDPHLTLPHPYYQERDFVLIPLLELQTGEKRCTADVKLYGED